MTMFCALSRSGLEHVIETLERGKKHGITHVDMGQRGVYWDAHAPEGMGVVGCFAGTYGAVRMLEEGCVLGDCIDLSDRRCRKRYWMDVVSEHLLQLAPGEDEPESWTEELTDWLAVNDWVWGNDHGGDLYSSPRAFGVDFDPSSPTVCLTDVTAHLERVLHTMDDRE